MKKLMTISALALFACQPAHADGPGNPWERPPVIVPPGAGPTWDGLQVGAGVTLHDETVETVGYEPGDYERECASLRPGTHGGNKCQLDKETYDHLVATGQFDEVDSPWGKDLDGPVLYDDAGYYGLWMDGNETVSFTSPYGGDAPTGAGKPTTNTVLRQLMDEVLSYDEERTVAATAFVRYWRDGGSYVYGGEVGYDGEVGYGELQAGYDLGRAVSYTGLSDDHVSLGVVYRLTRDGSWLGEARVALEGDDLGAVFDGELEVRPELRVAYKF